MNAPPPPPQSFPYDHLFKILTIGDAGVGKVRCSVQLYMYALSVLTFRLARYLETSFVKRERDAGLIGRNLSGAGLVGLLHVLLGVVRLFTWDTCAWSHDGISDNCHIESLVLTNQSLTFSLSLTPRRAVINPSSIHR
jgi:hypothetical protein